MTTRADTSNEGPGELRVLFLTRKHPPSVGGMQKLSAELVAALRGLVAERVIAWRHSQGWLWLFLPYCLVRAALALLLWRPHVIHLGDPVMCLVGLPLRTVFRVPCVVTVHGLDVTYPRSWYQRLIVPLIGRCDRVVCISHGTRTECARRGVGRNATVIPPGFWPHSAPQASDTARHQLASLATTGSDEAKTLLTVGRLVKRKGVARFIREILPLVTAEYPQAQYWVVGDGPERAGVERAVSETGLAPHVRLLGHVSEHMLAAIYETADVLVMPNVPVEGDMEGFGLVAVEANLAGLAVVAADLEGIQDAVEDGGNGYLVPWDDRRSMAQRILAILGAANPAALGRRVRTHALSRFAWDLVARRYRQVLAAAAGQPAEVAARDSARP